MCTRSTPVVYLACMMALLVNLGCPPGSNFSFYTDPALSIYASITSDAYATQVGQTETAGVDTGNYTGTVTYQWSITPPGVIVGSSTDPTVSFTATAAGTISLSVTATDSGTGTSATSTTQIDIVDVPVPLTVDAGPDQTVAVGYTALLRGSISGDGDESYFSVGWRQISGPLQTVIPEYANTLAITVVGTTPGSAIFELFGTNNSDTVTVVVTPATK